MYTPFLDESQSLLVGVFAGAPDTDDDFARCLAAHAACDRAAVLRRQPCVHILVTGRDVSPPPPVWRKRMAELDDSMQSNDYLLALVAASPAARGVLTAVAWLAGRRSGHKRVAMATFAAAATWVRTETGRAYPGLEQLYEGIRTLPGAASMGI